MEVKRCILIFLLLYWSFDTILRQRVRTRPKVSTEHASVSHTQRNTHRNTHLSPTPYERSGTLTGLRGCWGGCSLSPCACPCWRELVRDGDQPPKPKRVLPWRLRAWTTSMAVTVFWRRCSVYTTASRITF